jgi:hypothetical protein
MVNQLASIEWISQKRSRDQRRHMEFRQTEEPYAADMRQRARLPEPTGSDRIRQDPTGSDRIRRQSVTTLDYLRKREDGTQRSRFLSRLHCDEKPH